MRNTYCIKPAVALAVGSGETKYSETVPFNTSAGFVAALIVSTAGSITVTVQCSQDGTNWYDPIDSDANALGAVCAAMTVTTGTYIQFGAVVAPYIRFKVVEGAIGATAVSITLANQEG